MTFNRSNSNQRQSFERCSSHGNRPSRVDMLLAWLFLWPRALRRIVDPRGGDSPIAVQNLQSAFSSSPLSPTPQPNQPNTDSPLSLRFLNNDSPTQMPSSAQATSDSGLSSSQQSALDKLLQVMSQDSEALSVCSEKKPKGKANSLSKRVHKQLSRAKKNMDKLIKWLREVENV